MNTVFVLASQSPARRTVLAAAGVDAVVRVSGVDEDAIQLANPDLAPAEMVVLLARAKGESVVAEHGATLADAVVVSCDSMLHIGGDLVGKPGSVEQARRQWNLMAGTSGALLTGHVVQRVVDGRVTATAAGTESTVLHFGTPSTIELEAYLASGEPLHVAGSCTLDGLGGWFINRIDGDPSSVIGISLPLTRTLLAEVGVTVTDLWRPGTLPASTTTPKDI